jgi:hypothetical protein
MYGSSRAIHVHCMDLDEVCVFHSFAFGTKTLEISFKANDIKQVLRNRHYQAGRRGEDANGAV